MSVSIQVSYQHDHELIAITRRLEDLPLRVSKKEYKTGKFRRVYLRGETATFQPEGQEKRQTE